MEGRLPLTLSAKAGTGLTAGGAAFKFVKWASEGVVVLCDAATDVPCGVVQETPAAEGDAVLVVAVGITKVQAAAGAPAANDPIGTDANGQAAVYAVTDTTVYSVGRVISADGITAAGGLITAAVNCAAPARFA
ncbi:MAG: hypothetical protein ABFD60_01680 [Bryobacteraceae bacterium]